MSLSGRERKEQISRKETDHEGFRQKSVAKGEAEKKKRRLPLKGMSTGGIRRQWPPRRKKTIKKKSKGSGTFLGEKELLSKKRDHPADSALGKRRRPAYSQKRHVTDQKGRAGHEGKKNVLKRSEKRETLLLADDREERSLFQAEARRRKRDQFRNPGPGRKKNSSKTGNKKNCG